MQPKTWKDSLAKTYHRSPYCIHREGAAFIFILSGPIQADKKKTAVLISILMMLAWAWLSGNFQSPSSLEEEPQAKVEMD